MNVSSWSIRNPIPAILLFLLLTLARLRRARTADAIRRRAAALDQAGAAVLPLSLLAAAASGIVVGVCLERLGGEPVEVMP